MSERKPKEIDARVNPPSAGFAEVVNASGHRQELERNFGLWSIAGFALTSGNVWLALAGTLTVAIYNGGPAGAIYQFIVVSVFYWCIAASVAELASAMPSAGGVYHWASITGGKYGRACGFFAGWLNFFAWLFALASCFQLVGFQLVSMYAFNHPDYVPERWHVLIVYLITTWMVTGFIVLYNRALPSVESLAGITVIVAFFVTLLVCTILPASSGRGYATSQFVWRDWVNATGWSSDGLTFCLGMLNGAYAVGAVDVSTHMAEEVPRPGTNIPKAMLAQYVFGFVTGFAALIFLFYGITDLDAVLDAPFLFPLAAIYQQVTGSNAGGIGLLVVAFIPCFLACIGVYLTSSRVFWTLARDNATPFSPFFARVHPKFKNPTNAIVLTGVLGSLLACIYVGNVTAFNAFIGSFVVLTMSSYILAIVPHLITRRKSILPGVFWMGGAVGFAINIIACLFMIVFAVLFCFPFGMPVAAEDMNYTSVLVGGLLLFVTFFWFWRQKEYSGPNYVPPDADNLAKDSI